MTVDRTVGNSPESKCYRDILKEEKIKKICRTFKSYLNQFNLLTICEPCEVLNEAVIRLITALQKGNTILIPEAWIKKTGFNIIREIKRKQKCQNLDPNIIESVFESGEDISLNLIKEEESKTLHDALQKLSSENQQLINLRFFQRLSWAEIAHHPTQNGNNVAVATIRKRGERAINQLRKAYLDLM